MPERPGCSASPRVATSVYAAGIEPYGLVVTRYTPRPSAWPVGRKLSITVIADLHAGGPDMTLPHIRQIVEAANRLKSDLVVLLGDYTTAIGSWIRLFHTRYGPPSWRGSRLRLAPGQSSATTIGGTTSRISARRLLTFAFPCWKTVPVMLGANDQRFWLAGLGDQLAYRLGHGRFRGVDDLPGTLAQVQTKDPILLLAHEPDIFPRVPARVALTLSGHTHGGQIRVPLIWPVFVPSKYGTRFAYGHVVEEDRHLIVSGGLGTSLIPARLGVPPEIVHIQLGV